MKFLSDLKNKNLSNETCLLRADFNVKKASDNPRLTAVLPTIKFLTSRGARVVILSHRGRPKKKERGEKKEESFSLRFAADFLSKKLKKKVNFINFKNLTKLNFVRLRRKIKKAPSGSIFLLENLRFLPGERKNDGGLAKELAALGTFYVNDDFGVSHRNNASVVGITKFIPSYAGLLLEKEIKNLNRIVKNPSRPLVVIIGGVKISDKIGLIKNFLKKTDYFLIGGGISNTMFAAQGLPVGDSLYEPKMISFAKQLLESDSDKIILPIDVMIAQRKILDIGPQTIKKYSEIIKKAKTIIWNGPMGYIENPKFSNGSKEVAKAIMDNKKAFAVVGGGETTGLLKNKLKTSVFVSTGGGAMLEYLAGKKLPGLIALNR